MEKLCGKPVTFLTKELHVEVMKMRKTFFRHFYNKNTKSLHLTFYAKNTSSAHAK